MKKKLLTLTSLILALLFISSAAMQAGSQRVITTEVFTSASCGYCAPSNELLVNYVNSNPEKPMIPLTFRYNFGSDIMYNMNPSMYKARANFYGFSGVPHFFINGTQVIGGYTPQIPNIIEQEVQKHANEISPITIEIDETKTGNVMDFTVSVSSDEELSGKTLRICAVEYHHFYENAGSNSEKDFYYIVREMFPNANGEMISLEAGETKTFEYSYNINASMFNVDKMYVVAFIQNDGTREVLQAATSLNMIKPNVMTDVQYDTIEPNKILSKEVIISNPSDEVINFELSINQNNTVSWIEGWSAEVTPKNISVPPGGTKKFLVNIRSSSVAGFFWTEVVAEGTAQSGIVIPGELVLHALSTNTENVYYAGSSDSWVLTYNAFNQFSGFYKNTALMPVGLIQNYDPLQFDLVVFDVDYWNGGMIAATSVIPATIINLIEGGKDVLITAERELYLAQGQSGTSQALQLFRNKLGLELYESVLRVQVNSQNQITGVLPFKCRGFDEDPLGDGFNKQLNNWSLQEPYLVQTDCLEILEDSEAVPFLYYDNDKKRIAGIHWAVGTSRVVYTTFGFNAFDKESERNSFMNKVLTWLTSDAVAGPELALDKTSIDFGKVDLNKTKEKTFKIENDGSTKQELIIDKMTISSEQGDASNFSFIDLDNTISIPAGESYTVTIGFTPNEEKEYEAVLTVEADNSVDEKELSLNLSGMGEDSESSVATTSNGMFTMTAAPNPFETVSSIEYTVSATNSKPLNIFIMDASGKIVKTLVNSTIAPGTYNAELNSNGLASGTYYVIGQIMGESVRIPLILTK